MISRKHHDGNKYRFGKQTYTLIGACVAPCDAQSKVSGDFEGRLFPGGKGEPYDESQAIFDSHSAGLGDRRKCTALHPSNELDA